MRMAVTVRGGVGCFVRAAAVLCGLALGAGCRVPERRPDGTLSVHVHQAQVAVYLDDNLMPLGPGRGEGVVMLSSGVHRIEARAPGCFTAYQEVFVPPRGSAQVDLALRRDPDAEAEPACEPLRAPGP